MEGKFTGEFKIRRNRIQINREIFVGTKKII